jgi:tetratricopeptide (TPR) repeat protein
MPQSTTTSTSGLKNPSTASEYINKGWEQKSSGKLDEAEASFRKAISLESRSVEAYYGLALILKIQDRRQESIKSFEKVIELINSSDEDKVRGKMLQRLSKGHINQLSCGDWNLEKEIWKHA